MLGTGYLLVSAAPLAITGLHSELSRKDVGEFCAKPVSATSHLTSIAETLQSLRARSAWDKLAYMHAAVWHILFGTYA